MLTNILIFGEMYVLSLIYISAAVYRFCALSYVFFFFFASVCHFLIIQFMFLLFLLYLFFVFYFVYSMFLYCFVYCFSFCAVSCTSLPTIDTGWKPKHSK